MAITTVWAGNVIGGGDFANDRIIPDCIRAAQEKNIVVRNPYSTRPYQHVLEPLAAYLLIAQAQYENKNIAGSYNVGPDDVDCWTTEELVTLFCDKWNKSMNENIIWENVFDGGPHEANFLKLDCSKLKTILGWKPRWNVDIAVEKIIEWIKVYLDGGDIGLCMDAQIESFFNK